MKKIISAFVLILLCALCLTSSAQQSTEPYKDPKLPIEQRVNDLVSRMTVEEKASQLVHVAEPIPRLGVPAYNWWNEGLHGVARA
jgi:beta-glucosidase